MIYTTILGDTWDSIAYKTYGDSKLHSEIKSENPKYTDVILFEAGIKIVIPEIERKENNENAAPWTT